MAGPICEQWILLLYNKIIVKLAPGLTPFVFLKSTSAKGPTQGCGGKEGAGGIGVRVGQRVTGSKGCNLVMGSKTESRPAADYDGNITTSLVATIFEHVKIGRAGRTYPAWLPWLPWQPWP